jgi:spore coat protein U-like protein
MNARSLKLTAGCAAALLANGTALGATQGTLGATSTGSVSINASVPNRVQISGLSDVSFANQDPATPAANAQNVCVWSNTSTKGYNVTASGSGAGSAFTLSNGASTVPYSVEWSGGSGQSSGSALASGSALTGLISAATNATCASGPASSASLIVRISSANLQTMQAATSYTGTLTLVVAPE